MVQVLIVAGWIAIGGAVGFYEARRGHWWWLWLLGAIAGPVVIPLALQASRDEPYTTAVLGEGTERTDRSGLSVLDKHLLGSCATELARRSPVPVLIRSTGDGVRQGTGSVGSTG